MLLQPGAESNRRLTSECREQPPHPQPFSPTTRASTTRSRRGGEGSQNAKRGNHTECRNPESFVHSVASPEVSERSA